MNLVLIFSFISLFLLFSNCEDPLPPDGGGGTISPKIVWKYPNLINFSDWVQPIIFNNRTYIPFDSTLACFDLRSGNIIWQRNLGNHSELASSKLLFSDDKLYLNHVGWIKSFDLQGNLIWQTNMDNFLAIDLSIMSQNSTNLFLGRRGDVISVSKSSGNIDLTISLDSLLTNNSIDQNAMNPVISNDGLLYVPTGYYDPDNPPVRGNMFCYDAVTGEYKWGFEIPVKKILPPGGIDSVDIDAGSYGCAVKNDRVVFAAGQTIFVLNRFTGKLIWEKFFEDDAFGWDLTIEGNTIYIGSQAGAYIYALNLNTGNIIWKSIRLDGGMFNIITVQDGKVFYCNTLGGKIWIHDAYTGNVLWSSFPPEYQTDRDAIYNSNLAVGEGYMVNVGSKFIYCLKINE